jgi:hypothetical protein
MAGVSPTALPSAESRRRQSSLGVRLTASLTYILSDGFHRHSSAICDDGRRRNFPLGMGIPPRPTYPPRHPDSVDRLTPIALPMVEYTLHYQPSRSC